jgi:hypothetical protein
MFTDHRDARWWRKRQIMLLRGQRLVRWRLFHLAGTAGDSSAAAGSIILGWVRIIQTLRYFLRASPVQSGRRFYLPTPRESEGV